MEVFMKKIVFILIMVFTLFILSASILAKTDTDYDKALKYYYSGKYNEAVSLLKDYVKNEPDPSAYYLIGYALYELREYDEATKYFKQAYLINPKFSPEIVSPAKEEIKETMVPSVKQVPLKKPRVSVSKEKQPSKETQPQKTQEQAVAPVQAPPMPEPQKVQPQKEGFQLPSGFPKFPEPKEGLPNIPKLPAGLTAIIAGLGMIALLVEIAIYLYFCLCIFLIARKLNVPLSWIAWVPIVNIFWPLIGSARKPLLWGIISLLVIPLLGGILGTLLAPVNPMFTVLITGIAGLVALVAYIYLWMLVTENLGRNKWLGLLIILPIIQLVFIGVLAFSKTEKPQFAT
jgi:hypothetical protein